MEELDGDTPCRAICDLIHDKDMTEERRSSSSLPPLLAEVDRGGTTSVAIQAELPDGVMALLNAERGLCAGGLKMSDGLQLATRVAASIKAKMQVRITRLAMHLHS